MSSSAAANHNRRLLGHLLQARSTNRPSVSPLDGSILHWHSDDFDDHNFQIHGQTLLYLFILFSIILLATLLLLYARWYFRLRHLSAVAATAAAAAATPLPHHHSCQTEQKGLDFAAINSLPITLHQSSEVADDEVHDCECCICLGTFEEGDKVKVLPACQHRYHSHCVDVWLTSHSNCPLCRLPVRVDPIPV